MDGGQKKSKGGMRDIGTLKKGRDPPSSLLAVFSRDAVVTAGVQEASCSDSKSSVDVFKSPRRQPEPWTWLVESSACAMFSGDAVVTAGVREASRSDGKGRGL